MESFPRQNRDRARDSELERTRTRRIAVLFKDLRVLLNIPDGTREQLLQAYPSLPAFLARKDARDPHHVFSSNWHRWLRDTLAL